MLLQKYIWLPVVGILQILAVKKIYAQSYRAVVVAHKPTRNANDIPSAVIDSNKENYAGIINGVKDKADIVIFPEYGLTTKEPVSKSKAHLDSYSINIPNEGYNLCKKQIASHPLVALSCAALNNQVYVVFNAVEKADDGISKFYSTNVVFDTSGNIIKKCRKRYLYEEIHFDKGDYKECIFKAKFIKSNINVDFLLLFDTDLVLQVPNVTDVILTSSLRDSLPFSTGLSLQTGFAARNKVNLLAAGYVDTVNNYYGDSGIYYSNGTSKVNLNPGSMIADVPRFDTKISSSNVKVIFSGPKPSLELNKLPFENMTTLDMKETSIHKCIKGKYCCTFNAVLNSNSENSIEPFKWVAILDKIKFLQQDVNIFICAMITSNNQSHLPYNIKEVAISSTADKDNVEQLLPVSIKSDLIPANYIYEETDGTSTMNLSSLSGQESLLTFGKVYILKDVPARGLSIHDLHIFPISFSIIVFVAVTKYLI